MKRIIFTFIFILANTFNLSAQKGLAVAKLLDGHIPYYIATRVWVEGRELQPYKLSLYRSMTVKENVEAVNAMERAVLADATQAQSKEIGHVGNRLYYAFLCLTGGKNNQLRYIFYRNAALRSGGNEEATLVYMEGRATMDELQQMFKNTKTQKLDK